jgi:hypothetical protein
MTTASPIRNLEADQSDFMNGSVQKSSDSLVHTKLLYMKNSRERALSVLTELERPNLGLARAGHCGCANTEQDTGAQGSRSTCRASERQCPEGLVGSRIVFCDD